MNRIALLLIGSALASTVFAQKISLVGGTVINPADGKTIEKARIGLCAVAPTPKFAAEASQWLAGKPASEESFAQAGELAKKVASPITDMRGDADYRRHLVGVLVKRTLKVAIERAKA